MNEGYTLVANFLSETQEPKSVIHSMKRKTISCKEVKNLINIETKHCNWSVGRYCTICNKFMYGGQCTVLEILFTGL